ncbi:MAG: hypothetical protein GWN40_05040 [Nitrosopumilaceae archaeon]|nr:hypothetical protein [Nitrosopumilaceae archaeon]NIV65525.1 hypothetical protein [Nitrosopumilaceae archaeon]
MDTSPRGFEPTVGLDQSGPDGLRTYSGLFFGSVISVMHKSALKFWLWYNTV